MTRQQCRLRILIFGESFTRSDGGGITLTNLFRDFPGDSLASIVDANRVPALDPQGPSSRVYALGSKEKFARYPFSLFKQKYQSGPVDFQKLRNAEIAIAPSKSKGKFWLKSLFTWLLLFLGLPYWMFRFRMSEELHQWIDEFKPTHIYAQFNTIEMMLLLREIHSRFPVKLVTHFMDDWPSVVVKNGPFASYWMKRFDKEIRFLLSKTDRALSISEGMSEVFADRYGMKFEAFHNPIDITFWRTHRKMTYDVACPATLLYAGRIGLGASDILVKVAEAVHLLCQQNVPVQFLLQVPRKPAPGPVEKRLLKFEELTFVNPVPYDELPARFSSADLLLLPYDFDSEGMNFIRYSMPTKASEYMISGTPIVLIAPQEAFVARHAARHQWADCIDSENVEYIARRIASLLRDSDRRKCISDAAVQYAYYHFAADSVRHRFTSVFSEPSN